MPSGTRSGKGPLGVSPLERYLNELSSGLRLRDERAGAQLLRSMERDLRRSAPSSKSYGDLIKELGHPRELARKLSDPRNWTVQMGSPLMPKVPIAQAISVKGRSMIASFLVAMFILAGALFIMLPSDDRVYPMMLMASAMIYLLLSAVFYAFNGYIMTYDDLRKGGMGVEPCSRAAFHAQLITSIGAIMLLDAAMVLYPLAGNRGALLLSVPLGIPPVVLAAAVIVMVWSGGRTLA